MQRPGNGFIVRFSLHFGQHSPGNLICFDGGHCSTGHAFLTHVKRRLEHEHFRHGSSLSVTSRPSCTVWPLRLHPKIERKNEKLKKKKENHIDFIFRTVLERLYSWRIFFCFCNRIELIQM